LYELRIGVNGGGIKVYIDGVLKIDYTDTRPLQYGAIQYGGGNNITYDVDNVVVITAK
jgi:hypothetical protein